MDATTVKIHKSTKSALDELKIKNESYDEVITKLISKERDKNLRKELIEAYKDLRKEDTKILKEWEVASAEVD